MCANLGGSLEPIEERLPEGEMVLVINYGHREVILPGGMILRAVLREARAGVSENIRSVPYDAVLINRFCEGTLSENEVLIIFKRNGRDKLILSPKAKLTMEEMCQQSIRTGSKLPVEQNWPPPPNAEADKREEEHTKRMEYLPSATANEDK